jgi:hypothetical protein
MMAKNVGIRRARGQFVLVTNVDILFSDELMAFLASRRLDGNRLYRIDRHDVMADVPGEASVDDQLAYCRSHLLRVHTRESSFTVEPEGRRALELIDIAPPDAGLRFGRGWYQVWDRNEPSGVVHHYRGAAAKAELLVTTSDTVPPAFMMDIEPGPGCKEGQFELHVRDSQGNVATSLVRGRQVIHVTLPLRRNATHEFTLEGVGEDVVTPGEPRIGPGEPRIVKFRMYRCGWARPAEDGRTGIPQADANTLITAEPEPAIVSPQNGMLNPVDLHTNGCGDFTLLARERWFDLRGYAEFKMFSFHLDALFLYAAHHAGAVETVLPEPMRIYHIEHGIGSGWTPEGQSALFDRLSARGIPSLDLDVLLSWAVQMRRYDAPAIFNRSNWGLAEADLPETVIR